MKKIILTVAAVFAFGVANAQDAPSFGFAKGDMFLGGSISFNSTDDDGDKTSFSEISPEFGYFINDKFALTAGLTIYNEDNGFNKPSALAVDLGARYYFLNLGERFKTYTNFGFGFGSFDDDMGGDKTNFFSIGGGLGINYFVTSRLAIDFGLSDVLSYNSMKNGDYKYSETNLNVNVFNNFFSTATFGVIYKL